MLKENLHFVGGGKEELSFERVFKGKASKQVKMKCKTMFKGQSKKNLDGCFS